MDNNEDIAESDHQEGTHVRGKHTLDPKVIHHLEMEILKSMSGGGNLDPLFNSGLPDASMTAAGTTTLNSSIFNSSQSFTMESLTLDTLTMTNYRPDDKEELKNSISFFQCCKKSNVPTNNPQNNGQNSNKIEINKNSILLPPQLSEDKDKITLVLDLDETLVHSSFLGIPHADFRFVIGIEQNPVGVFVCIRPGAERFLRELGNLFEIVIFTASCQVYADSVIDFIDKGRVVKHRLYRESCTDFGGNFIKDLSRLNRNLEKIIIVDNSSIAYLLQPSNAIAITSWFDDPTDDELFIILEFLKQHHRTKNVYDILSGPE